VNGADYNGGARQAPPKTLIFVDTLGFEAMTELHHIRVQDFGPDEHRVSGSSTTEMPNRINRFNHVLGELLKRRSWSYLMNHRWYSQSGDVRTGLEAETRASSFAVW
jgi:hypothetical protein